MRKKLVTLRREPDAHWVGDGFPVRTLFTYEELGEELSPFLLLDHAGPASFPPSQTPRGVGFHPHRGFETVTIVFQGELEHRDTAGNSGRIGPGDVQWMTAASGVLHEELHSRDFSREGGTLQMAQLWVNLPASQKMSAPRYQALLAREIPSVGLPDDAGTLRVIAGAFDGALGPARTVTPMNVWELRLHEGAHVELRLPSGQTAALVVLTGAVRLDGEREASESSLAIFDREGDQLAVEAPGGAMLLLLGGEPILEPIVGRGPFVMNTEAEIRQAYRDFADGRMGRIESMPGAPPRL
jgi:redox-sensitive bicupin YhaK (pirin superfamily)